MKAQRRTTEHVALAPERVAPLADDHPADGSRPAPPTVNEGMCN